MELNVDGYKMIFFLENLLRDYVCRFFLEENFPKALKEKSLENAKGNGVAGFSDYRHMLDYLHLGELIDVCKSREFVKIKANSLSKANVSVIRTRRNTIMHSRLMTWDQAEQIRDVCSEIVKFLKDNDTEIRWNKFIKEEIAEYAVPKVFVEYPLGKDFESLIGRDETLKDLKIAIKYPTPVSVVRHGGLGKTALVLQLIVDLMYAPDRPFERIYFMSFKNTVFENGRVRTLEKVISNHQDLINRLAYYMGISIDNKEFEEIEVSVWNEVFSRPTLLVLDNLESEVVRTNLSEFIDIAGKFMRKFMSQSRLIITSRYGLGDREQKIPVLEFVLEETKLLVQTIMGKDSSKLRGASEEDWQWIQSYSKGNPGLIISFCHTLKSTLKNITNLRIEYNTQYTEESRTLHSNMDSFLGFCFENTIESLPRQTQIFQLCIAFICSEVNIREIGSELLTFLIEGLNLGKLGDEYLRAITLENTGFLQRISGTDKYYINELFVEYLNGNYAQKAEVMTVFDLKNTDLYPKLQKIISDMNDIQFDDEHSVGQIVSQIYQSKFRISKDISLLLKAFLSNPSVKNLIEYYSNEAPTEVLNNFPLMDKVKGTLQQKLTSDLQERLSLKVLQALLQVNQLIVDRQINTFRQNDLYQFFEQLEKRCWIFKNKSLSRKLRETVCMFLIQANRLDRAEQFVAGYEDALPDLSLQVYTKFVGSLAGTDHAKCLQYIQKCEPLLQLKGQHAPTMISKSRFIIFSSRYYLEIDPETAYNLVLDFGKNDRKSPTMYLLYLESLLIRAQCLVKLNNDFNEVKRLIGIFHHEKKTARYRQQIRPKKQRSFDKSIQWLERSLYSLRS